ncbi:MAG: universal stress protein [Betaproteobacteria bacterium]|nr:universal stress protein [Betaproteobacteria bacterium]
MKILVAVDGSKPSLEAVDWLISHARQFRLAPAVELLTVHEPIAKLARFGLRLKKAEIARWYRGQGEADLKKARERLQRAGLRFRAQIRVGPVARTIVQQARRTKCDLIVIGSSGMGAAGSLLAASVAAKVLHLARCPVLLAR